MAKRNRRKPTDDFTRDRRDTVRLIREEGKSVGEGCDDLDLTESAVRAWLRQAEIDDGKGARDALATVEGEEIQGAR